MATAKAIPYRWSYADQIGPLLERSAELVTMDDSERRSLILVKSGPRPAPRHRGDHCTPPIA